MQKIGIICEFNPFHNGHQYFINQIKKKYPDSVLIAIVSNYFTERGDISVIDKDTKTRLALESGIDIVISLPVYYTIQSADYFAWGAINTLNKLDINTVIFGSESNDIKSLEKVAFRQLNNFKLDDKKNSYAKRYNETDKSNDILGIAYIKAITKINPQIKYETIKRTNNYNNLKSNQLIISANNIRNKLLNKESIIKYIPYSYPILNINYNLLFDLIKYKINTDNSLDCYLTVDEGIEYRLQKYINNYNNISDFILKVKSKRYTYLKIQRMLIHILLGITKKEANKIKDVDYIQILGFNDNGQKHLKTIDYINNKSLKESVIYKYEKRAIIIYEMLTNSKESKYKPIKITKN